MALDRCLHSDDVGECHALKDALDAEGDEEAFGCGEPLDGIRIASAHAELRRVILFRRAEEGRRGEHGGTLPPSSGGHFPVAGPEITASSDPSLLLIYVRGVKETRTAIRRIRRGIG